MRGRLFDGLLGAVLLVPIVAGRLDRGDLLGTAVVSAVMALAVLAARRAPMAAVTIVLLGTLLDGNFVFAVPVLSYLAGLRTNRVGPAVAVFLAIAVGGTALNFGPWNTEPAQWFVLAMTLLLAGVFPWLLGRYRAQQTGLVSAGWERAARLEYERQMLVRQVELRERARIAQEMHDRLGHELALVALGAGALETAPDVPERHAATAARIRESAAAATDQLRAIIGVLQERDGEDGAQADDEPVEAVVERARDSGMAVTVRRSGGADAVPAAVERATARIVREALTNVGRHAPGAATTVEIGHRIGRTGVTVVNTSATRPVAGATTGIGLIGLRERARLLGGTLTAGPAADGGFRVVADLPHQSPPHEGRPVEPAEAALRSARRRVRRTLATAVGIPAVLAVVATCGYYAVAVSGTELSGDTFDSLTVGTARSDIGALLPRRQVWRTPGPCEVYTDGNFPLAAAAYRLCFADGRLVSKERLR